MNVKFKNYHFRVLLKENIIIRFTADLVILNTNLLNTPGTADLRSLEEPIIYFIKPVIKKRINFFKGICMPVIKRNRTFQTFKNNQPWQTKTMQPFSPAVLI